MQHRPSTKAVVSSFVLGFVLPALLMIAALRLGWIAAHIDPAFVSVLTLAVCYGLYAIRKLRPLAYGTAEVLIGVMVVFLAMQSATMGVPDEPAAWLLVAKLAAGVYIVVRGIDNMERSPLAGNDRARWLFECRWGRKWKE